MREYKDIPELAERWRCSNWTVRRRLKEDLPHVRIGGRILIDLADIERYEAARKQHAGPAARRAGHVVGAGAAR